MPTTGTFFKAWLIFSVVATVLGFGVGAFVGFIVGTAMGASGVEDIQQVTRVCAVLGFIARLPVSFVTFRWAVSRFVLPHVSNTIDTRAAHG